jgi:hypothetical protein
VIFVGRKIQKKNIYTAGLCRRNDNIKKKVCLVETWNLNGICISISTLLMTSCCDEDFYELQNAISR